MTPPVTRAARRCAPVQVDEHTTSTTDEYATPPARGQKPLSPTQQRVQARIKELFGALIAQGLPPNEAAAQALERAIAEESRSDRGAPSSVPSPEPGSAPAPEPKAVRLVAFRAATAIPLALVCAAAVGAAFARLHSAYCTPPPPPETLISWFAYTIGLEPAAPELPAWCAWM